jgi:hypothetical protein
MSTHGYPRTSDLPFTELNFGAPSVLDVDALAQRWHPWIRLTDSTTAPLRARHAVHLLRLLRQPRTDEPHWFGMVSVATARVQVVRQCRLDEYVCGQPDTLPSGSRTSEWQELLDRLERWSDQDVTARTTIVTLLTQLGFARHVLRLIPSPAAGDSQAQHLAYEVARAGHQLNRISDAPFQVFEWLAANADHPMLRLLSALQFVSSQVREHSNAGLALRWLTVAGRLSDELTGPPAIVHLGRSRFHRAAALYYVLVRDLQQVAVHMTAALGHDDALADLDLDEVHRHYERENRRLVLEAMVKLDTMAHTAHAPATAVSQIAHLDPFDPDPGFTVGHFHESRSEWLDAAAAYLRAAAGGTVRGAHAAHRAGECLRRADQPDQARLAYRLCHDLDPAADVPLPADVDVAVGRLP